MQDGFSGQRQKIIKMRVVICAILVASCLSVATAGEEHVVGKQAGFEYLTKWGNIFRELCKLCK